MQTLVAPGSPLAHPTWVAPATRSALRTAPPCVALMPFIMMAEAELALSNRTQSLAFASSAVITLMRSAPWGILPQPASVSTARAPITVVFSYEIWPWSAAILWINESWPTHCHVHSQHARKNSHLLSKTSFLPPTSAVIQLFKGYLYQSNFPLVRFNWQIVISANWLAVYNF